MASTTMDDQIQQPAGNGAAGHLDDETLNAYLDATPGNAEATTRAAIDAHLAACAPCRERLADLAATVTLLHALPDVAPPRSFVLTPEIVAGGVPVRRPRILPRQPSWVWPARWASIAAAFLLALTIGLDLHDGNAPARAATQPTVQAVATPTAPVARATAPDETPLVAFGTGSIVIIGTPIPVAEPAPAPAPFSAVGTEHDWHEAETGLGVLALITAFFGFLLPPVVRWRASAAS
ncbi:MAG: anti-sigma factor family protein [Thermomicrobiales bacterium]